MKGRPVRWLLMKLADQNLHFLLPHLSHWLRMSYCDHWMSVGCRPLCVAHRQQLLQMTSPPKLMTGF